MFFHKGLKKAISAFLVLSFIFMNSAYAVETVITTTGQTQTQITGYPGNNINIQTQTQAGDMGVNAFNKFNVGEGTTVNLNLINQQNKLLNLIYDNSASQIDGVINSYKNGAIGGNVLFANPNGFVIGENGVFNVGSLTMMTPTADAMNSIFKDGQMLQQPLNDLISFSIDSERSLFLRKNMQMNSEADIVVKGTINAHQGGVDLIAGRNIEIQKGASVNANTTLTPADMLVNTPGSSFTTAINDGHGIIIVSKNNSSGTDGKNQTVNIDGIVNTNAPSTAQDDSQGSILISAQSDKSGKSAAVNINEHAIISGNNIDISAINKIDEFDKNIMGISDDLKHDMAIVDDIIEYFTPNLADINATVTINSGARVSAVNDLNLHSLAAADISSSVIFPDLSINYSQLDAVSNVLVKNGAELKAENLSAKAETDIKLNASSKSSSLLDKLTGMNAPGNLAVLVINESVNTNSTIENGAILNVGNDITVNAETKNYVTAAVKNGAIPVLDKNQNNGFSGSVGVSVIDVQTSAVMNADADIDGSLDVSANAVGRVESKVSSSAGGDGESGRISTFGKTLIKNILFDGGSTGKTKITKKVFNKLDDVKTRGGASFNKFDLAAGVNVNVTDYDTDALIGSDTLKPTINAKNINVAAKTVDDASNIVTIATAENAKTSAAGAFSVHIKTLDTNALANGNFTINNSDDSKNALNITADTQINHPLSYYTWAMDFWNSLNIDEVFSLETLEKILWVMVDSVDADGGTRAPDTSQLSDVLSSPDIDILMKGVINFDNLGLEGLYNTYSQAAANAKVYKGETLGLSGAVAINVMDTFANAGLLSDANVVLSGGSSGLNNINISSYVKNESWVMSALFKPMEFSNLMMPGARDGSAAGGGLSLNYSNNDSKAFIGKNVTVSQTAGEAGNITVDAKNDGNYVTVAQGSSNADNSGSSGAIGLTLSEGETSARIEDGASIYADNITVNAVKDANFVNAVIAFSLSEKSIAFGISGIGLWDTITAYTGGNITVDTDLKTTADSDNVIVNIDNNIGLAKAGTDPPAGQREAEDAMAKLNEIGKGSGRFSDIANAATGAIANTEKASSSWAQSGQLLKEVKDVDNAINDWERKSNPDKETSAYAGTVNANVTANTVKSLIGEGAVIKAGNDVVVSSGYNNITVNEAGAVSANGKTGGGGSLVTDVMVNNVSAGIEKNAQVDAKRNLSVDANQTYTAVQAGLGIAAAKNKSGAGTVGVMVQVNDTKSFINEGVQINQIYKDQLADSEQSVTMNAKNKNLFVKALGALGIQAGGQASGAKAIGGTVDTTVLTNTTSAVVEGTAENKVKLNARKNVTVDSKNENKFINADVSGAASTQGSAYSGLLSTNVVVNETSASVKNAEINTNGDVEIKADSDFYEVAVAGAVAIGNQSAYGATLRVDVISDNIKSYIEDSAVSAKNLDLKNVNTVGAVSVLASGGASNDGKTAVGAVGVIVDNSVQHNYIANSTLNLSGDLSLDSLHDLDLTAVTGNVALANSGSSLGGSLFALAAVNEVKTYLESTAVIANSALINSSTIDDVYAITAGGALSTGGSAYEGAISLITNTGTVESYVKDGSVLTTGNIANNAQNPGTKISADKNIKNRQYNGQVSVSLNENAVGGAVSTTVQTNTVKAYAENTVLSAAKGVEVNAKSEKFVESTPVGVSAGKNVAVQGSVDTNVLTDDVIAYISDSDLYSDTKVLADNNTTMKTVVGGAAVSGSASVGAAVYTNVITGETKAYIENSNIKNDINDLTVKATTEENINVLAASGSASFGNVAVAGVVNTPVITRDTIAYIDNVDSVTNGKSIENTDVEAISHTTVSPLSGGVSASAGAGVGATAYTLVLDKDVKAHIKNSNIQSKKVKVFADLTDDVYSITLAGGFAGTAGVGGAVSTSVFSNDVRAGIENTVIQNADTLDVNAKDTTNLEAIVGGMGGGQVGVGASANTNVLNNYVTAYVEKSSADVSTTTTVKADIADNFKNTVTVSGAAGEVGLAGSVNTNVISNTAKAYFVSTLTGSSNLTVNASDILGFETIADGAIAGGFAGVGLTVLVNSISNDVDAYLGGNIHADNVNVNAKTQQTFSDIYAMGFGIGGLGGAGTVMVNTINNKTQAYTTNGTSGSRVVINSNKLTLDAQSITKNDAFTASGGIGSVGVGATVFVNNITNKTKALTGNFNEITTSDKLSLNAFSKNVFGDSSKRSGAIAGAVAGTFAIAGTVLTNSVNDRVIAGVGNNNIVSAGSININAKDETSIYTLLGSAALGQVAVGAGVNVNTVNNTVNSFIGSNNIVTANSGDIVIDAQNKVVLDNQAYIIGGGLFALSGGVVISNVGKNVASYSDADVKKNESSAQQQTQEAVDFANEKIRDAISAVTENTEEGIRSGSVEVTNTIERNDAISAFIGDNTSVSAKNNLSITALDDTTLDLQTMNVNVAALSVGVSGAVTNTNSTSEAFIGQNSHVSAGKDITLKASSKDNSSVDTMAAGGGIVGISSNFSLTNSNKLTNVYTLSGATMNSDNGDVLIQAISNAIANSYADSWQFGGIVVGAAIAHSTAQGETTVKLGKNNAIVSGKKLTIQADSSTNADAASKAVVGSLVGGTGAESKSAAGQNVVISADSDFNAKAGDKLVLNAKGAHKSTTDANGRSYGIISAGGAVADSQIKSSNTIKIADGGKNNTISAKSFETGSILENETSAKTLAGAGAILAVSGSGSSTGIVSSNNIDIGSLYDIISENGDVSIIATTENKFKSYNDSSAYGVIAAGAGTINNNVSSDVSVNVNANSLNAKLGKIFVNAQNTTTKVDTGYDLKGGSGGLVGVGAANLKTTISHYTTTTFSGNEAIADKDIAVAAQNKVNVTEKVDIYAAGGIPSASGYVAINDGGQKINSTVNISNKNIKAGEDVTYKASSDIYLYGKSNITVRGMAPIADGTSRVKSNSENRLNILSGSVTGGLRDVFLEASANSRVNSYISSDSQGLLWDLGDASTNAYNTVFEEINIASNSIVDAYDKLSISSFGSHSEVGSKSAKTVFYLIFGIPITIRNSDNSDGSDKTKISSQNKVVLDGNVSSGKGAVRQLNINYDESGNIIYDGNIEYGEYQQDSGVTAENVDETIKNSKGRYEEEKEALVSAEKSKDITIAEKDAAIKSANTTIQTNTNTISELQTNQGLLDSVSEKIAEPDFTLDASEKNLAVDAINNSLITQAQKNKLIGKINSQTDFTVEELTSVKTALGNYKSSLGAQISTLETRNSNLQAAIANQQSEIEKLVGQKSTIAEGLQRLEEAYNEEIKSLEAQKNAAGNQTLKISFIDIKDTKIRSGETEIKGTLSGTGSISAPGNKFQINIDNNTLSNIKVNNLEIAKDVKGKIYINDKDVLDNSQYGSSGGVSLNLRNASEAPVISINNNIDANDPSFGSNQQDNAGDMYLNGIIQNVSGSVNVKNLSGSIISEGSTVAKSVSMFVPNGDMYQGFSDQFIDIAGKDGTGSGIYAGGDITIMARSININGLIQSGTANKNVVINAFETRATRDSGGNITGYEQKIGSDWVEMKKSPNPASNWYLIDGNATAGIDMTDENNHELIKAYWDPDTNQIQLFNAEIMGGDVTLIGNIVSTGNGRIEVVSGYGHIDVINNSGKDLVVNSLSADNKIDGKVTLIDFYGTSQLKNSAFFDDLAVKYQEADKENLKASAFWTTVMENANEFSAQKDANGNVVVSDPAKGGSFAKIAVSADGRGAVFTPDSDSNSTIPEDTAETKTIREYVPKSWFYELFFGKTFRDVTISVDEGKWIDAKQPVAIAFSGYDDARINISSSNSSVFLNNNISAIDGNVFINSGNAIKNVSGGSDVQIIGKNVSLTAANDIGEYNTYALDKSIKVDLNGGRFDVFTAAGSAYVSLIDGNLTNFDIRALNGLAYVNAMNGNLNAGSDSVLKAKTVSLKADNGDINVKIGSKLLAQDSLSAQSGGDVDIDYDGDLTIGMVKSAGNTTISAAGNILKGITATEDTANIEAANIRLSALNGSIGSLADGSELTLKSEGTITADAKNDISLSSLSNMFVNKITAGNDVKLIAEKGIINANADADNDSFAYNIKANNLTMAAVNNNIENITVNLDGTLSAYAGYDVSTGEMKLLNADSVIQINQSTRTYTKSEADSLSESDLAGLKDLKIDNILAPNAILTGEKSIIDSNFGVIKTADSIVLTAINGSVGSLTDFFKVTQDGTVSAYAKDSVFISSEKDLKIKEIMGFNDKDSNSASSTNDPLKKVVLKSQGSILDGNKDTYEIKIDGKSVVTANEKPNVIAMEIELFANGDVGTAYDSFDVLTVDGGSGLSAIAGGSAFIASLQDVELNNIETAGSIQITAKEDIYTSESQFKELYKDIKAEKITTASDLTITSNSLDINDSDIVGVVNVLANDSVRIVSSSDLNIDTITAVDADKTLNKVSLKTNSGDILDANQKFVKQDFGGPTVEDTKNEEANISAKTIEIDAFGNLGSSSSNFDVITSAGGEGLSIRTGGNSFVNSYQNLALNEIDVKGNANFAVKEYQHTSSSDYNEIWKDISINNAKTSGTLNITADNVDVKDAGIIGVLNINADNTINFRSCENINLGTINNIHGGYSTNLNLETTKDILSANTGTGPNILAQNINLNAKNVGASDKAVVINLPDENTFNANSANLLNLHLTGKNTSIGSLSSNNLMLLVDNDIFIDSLKAQTADIRTNATNLEIANAQIKDYAQYRTADKFVVNENRSTAPRFDADAQIQSGNGVYSIKMDNTNNIITNREFVTRQNTDIKINGDYEHQSMNSAANASAVNTIQNNSLTGLSQSGSNPEMSRLNYNASSYNKNSTPQIIRESKKGVIIFNKSNTQSPVLTQGEGDDKNNIIPVRFKSRYNSAWNGSSLNEFILNLKMLEQNEQKSIIEEFFDTNVQTLQSAI